MKKIKKNKLKKNLKKFNDDLKKIKACKKRKSKNLAKKFAEDIMSLNNDALTCREDKTANLIFYMLNTPLGAPFVSKKTFFEAALNYNYHPKDLNHIISDVYKYDVFFNDELFFIFDSFLKKIK